MELGYAIAKGVVQGLTEFLPISSTAHLVFMDALSNLFGWQLITPSKQEEEFFNILVQVGTLGAVAYYFRSELWLIANVILKRQPDISAAQNFPGTQIPLQSLPKLIAISTTITCVLTLCILVGSKFIIAHSGLAQYGISDISEFFFHFPQLVAFHLIVTGLLLVVSQKLADKNHVKPSPMTIRQAMLIGAFQSGSAIFHGLSRSGSTISAGLMGGMDRVSATRYSFLLSVPTFILATIYETVKFAKSGHITQFSWIPMIIGTVVAGVVGYYCVKGFVNYIAKHSMVNFAYYCWAVGGLFLIYFSLNPPALIPIQ